MDKYFLRGIKIAAQRAETLELAASGALAMDTLAMAKFAEKTKRRFDWKKGLATAGVIAGGTHALIRKGSWSPTWMDKALKAGHKLHTPARVGLGMAGGGGIASIPAMVGNPLPKVTSEKKAMNMQSAREGARRFGALFGGKKPAPRQHKIIVNRANGRTRATPGEASTHTVTDNADSLRRELQAMGMKVAAVLGKKPVVLTNTKMNTLLAWEARERSGKTNPLESSNLERVSYNPGRRTLTVEFRKGGLYRYKDVPPEAVESLLKAESHGKNFHENIKKPGYAYKRLI